MAYKFTYYTVQHSATRFLESYFVWLNFSPLMFTQRCRICRESYDYTHKHVDDKNKSGKIEYMWGHYTGIEPARFGDANRARKNYPIVSTLRHPYKTAISFLSRKYDLRICLNMWESFIDTSIKRSIIYFDIECPKEHRKKHLLNVVRAVDCYEEEHEALTDDFVNNWKPVGVYRSDYKTDYINNGTLPDVFDWSRFDRAVNWYNKRIEEVRDNLAS